jgi:hypothetical protein
VSTNSESSGFIPRPGDCPFWLRSFLNTSSQMVVYLICLKLGHWRFVPHSFLFILSYSYNSTSHILSQQNVVKYRQTNLLNSLYVSFHVLNT